MENNVQQKELPLFTLYVAGLPNEAVFFYERAAAELKINLKVEYHGCCIGDFIENNGNVTTDSEYKSRKYTDPNLIAEQFYKNTHGENWLEQVVERAKKLVLEDKYTKLLDEYSKLEEKSKKKVKSIIYSTIILNVIFFAFLWTIFNIYIGIIACSIFSLISYFIYKRKFNKEDKILAELKYKMHKNDMSYFDLLHK